MNNFIQHVFGCLDRHDKEITKLSKANSKAMFITCIIGLYAVYQSMRVDDIRFELDRLKNKIEEELPEENS